jgi:pimeloyl-ACP methyl ester carboxylesterase
VLILLVPALTLGVVILLFLYQAAGTAADRRRFPPPGRLVDIGGRRLHVSQAGQGRPAVIFEAGIAASSLNWTTIQAGVARFTRSCSYDRAWLGWSDLAATPRLISQLVEELHALLAAAEIPPPYVLAAHSFGGLVVNAYAVKYPEQVAGLVLVDPLPAGEWLRPSEAQWARLRRGIRLSRRGALLARSGLVRLSLAMLLGGARRVPKLVARWSSGQAESVLSRLVTEVRKMPAETWPVVQAHWCQAKCFLGMAAYLESLPASSAEASEASGPPANIPLTILSAANSTPEQIAEREALALRSTHGKHVITEYGHWIHLDDPELVIQAIREMVFSARHDKRD